jgi:hypothetical protein
MKLGFVLFIGSLLSLVGTSAVAIAPTIPNPMITFVGTEAVTVGGKNLTRYRFDVTNKSDFPKEMFVAASTLPPCGSNTNASRTWIDLYDQQGKRLNGFCDVTDPNKLTNLWFATDEGAVPPSWIYIMFNDRQTSTKYKSNLADTVQ